MKKKRKHMTTKNTIAKPPVKRFMVINVECNGKFALVTDFKNETEFDEIFKEWFDSPFTIMWCAESLIAYIKMKQPSRICLLEDDYKKMIDGKGVIPATKAEWEAENN